MADRIQDLGVFTAYGEAREAGYEGSKAEFELGLKKSAEYSENAQASATAAQASADDAELSAAGAAESAEDAETSAGEATQSATDAAASATAAAASATQAASNAQAALGDIAPVFDTTKAYNVGDYVIYTDGKLYRFTADHAAGAWVGTDVMAVAIGQDVSELKSAINAVKDGGEATGEVVASGNKWVAYPVKAGETYVFTNVSENSTVMQVHTVNGTNYNYIEDVTHGNLPAMASVDFTATLNATHIIIYANGTGNYSFLVKESLKSATQDIQDVATDLLTVAGKETLIYNPSRYGSFNANGVTSSFGRLSTELIPFNSGNTIYVSNSGAVHAIGMWRGTVSSENIVRNDNSWRYSDEIITPNFDGYIIVVFKRPSDNTFYPISECNGLVTITRANNARSYNEVVRSVCRIAYGLGDYNSTGVPQQSIVGFLKAFFMGYRIMLVDLRFTSDGVPVCFHDDYLNHIYNVVTDGAGNLIPKSPEIYLNTLSFADLNRYDFGEYIGVSFKGTKILKFEDMVALCDKLGCELYIEQKVDDMTASEYDTVFEILSNYNMLNQTTWCPQTTAQLTSITAYNSKIPVCFHTNLNDGASLPDSYVNAIIAATNEYNFGKNTIGLNANATVTQSQILQLQNSGIGLHVIADSGEDIDTFFNKGKQYHCVKEFLTNGFIAGKYINGKMLYTSWFPA